MLDPDAPRIVAIDDSGDEVENAEVKTDVRLWNSEEKRFTVESAAPARIRLHLVNYRPWRATRNGAPLTPQTENGSGLMIIPVPAGRSEVRVWFGHTSDRTAGPVVSLLGLAIFAVVAWRVGLKGG